MLLPSFANLITITGGCIDSTGENKYAALIPDEIMREQQGQIQRVLRGEKPDYLPFSADLRWWFAERWHAATLERDLEGVDLNCLALRQHHDRVNIYKVEYEPDSKIQTHIHWSGKPIRYVRGGYPGEVRVIEIYTPVGTLRATEKYTLYTFGITEYLIKSVEDLRIFRYLLEHCRVASIPINARMPASNMAGPKTPMQAFIVELAGITNTAYLMADASGEMEEMMKLIARIEGKIYEIAANSEISSVGICENISSENSGGYFDCYIGPQLAEWSNLLHAHGKKLAIHMDGTLKPILSCLQNVGIDFVNGITAAPVGDVEVEHLREMAGDQLIIQDILPNSIFTSVFSDSGFEEYIRKAILHFKNDNRIILGIGDMLPLNGSIKRVEKVARIARELTAGRASASKIY